MPFTLAHPAAVLPLRYLRYLRTAPLFIGAMVPDAPYFVPFGSIRAPMMKLYTHSVAGSWSVDLPLGIVALACALLLREPLTVLLPARARWLCLTALEPYRRHASEWLIAPVAILLGVWTHLLWDSFTHPEGWGVRHFPSLDDAVTLGPYSGELCHILQYLSSAIGLAIVAVWYLRLRVPAGAADAGHDARRAHAGPALLLIAGAALLIGGVQAVRYYMRPHSEIIYGTVEVLLTRGLAWFVLLLLFGGAIVALEHRAAGARLR